MFLDTGRHGEHIGIEDNVLRREADLLGQHLVGPGANLGLAGIGIGLALFIEGHDDHCRTIGTDLARLGDEFFLAFLHGDRIHDPLALDAFQACLDDVELRGINHHRHTGNVRLGGNEVEELHHRLLAVEQALIHVDVDDLGAIRHLVTRNIERFGKLAVLDQLAKLCRARDIGPLADIDEGNRLVEHERLEARQAQLRFDLGKNARRLARHRFGDRLDMGGRRATATTHHIDQTSLGKLPDQGSCRCRALVIKAEFVRQAGIGIGADQRIRNAGDFGDMRPHFPARQGRSSARS